MRGGLGDRVTRYENGADEVMQRADSDCATAAAGDSPLDACVGPWWLVHTKPRNEKALSADLDRGGISHFLPTTRCRRVYGGRTFHVDLPLFPSYLFLCGGDHERCATLRTHRAVQVIAVVDQQRLRAELRQIHRATTSGHPVDLYPALRRGRRCRVVRGSLTGLEGVILKRRGIWRLYLGVEILGQSAEVEVDSSSVEAID